MPAAPRVTHNDLFLGFLAVSLSGFGGVLPFARRMIVERRQWLSENEFIDLLGLCQFLPGPNVVNVSICIGARFHGLSGAFCAVSGLLIGPFCLVLSLAALHGRFSDLAPVRGALAGVGAAAAGLAVAMGLRMAVPYRRNAPALVLAGLTFAAAALLRLPLHWVLLVLAPISVAVAWRRR